MNVPYSLKRERIEKFNNKEWLIRCMSCGDLVDSRKSEYFNLLDKSFTRKEALDKMRIFNHCTRAHFLKPYTIIIDYRKLANGIQTDPINISKISSRFVISKGEDIESDIIPLNIVNKPADITIPVINPDDRFQDYYDPWDDDKRLKVSCITYKCHY